MHSTTGQIIALPRRGAFAEAAKRQEHRRDAREIRCIVNNMRMERGTDSWPHAVEELQDAVFDRRRSRYYQRLAIRVLTRLCPAPGELPKIRPWSQETEDELDRCFGG